MTGYNINYTFRLIDQFSGGAIGLAAAMGRVTAASNRLGAAVGGVVAGGALVSMFSSAVAEAAKFEAKLSEVRKVVQDMDKASMWKIGDQAMRIAAATGVTKNEVAEIFAGGARMGIRGEDALTSFAETVTKVKLAWDGVSATMAGEALGRITGQFFGDLPSDEAQKRMIHVADAINYLGQNIAAAKPLEQLKFFQRAGNLLRQGGLTAEEAAAWGSAAISAGVSGSLEGTQAAAAFMRIDQKALIDRKRRAFLQSGLGINPDDYVQFRKQEGGMAAGLKLLEAIERLPAEKRVDAIGKVLGDARAGRQMVALVGQMNKLKQSLAVVDTKWARRFLGLEPGWKRDEGFLAWLGKVRPDQLEKLEKLTPLGKTLADGSVNEEVRALLESLIAQSNRLSEAWSNLLVNLGKPMLPPLTDMTAWLATNIQGISDAIAANPALGTSVLYGVGAAVAASLWAGITAGMTARAGTSLLGRLLIGGAIGALTLTVGIALVGAGAWIFLNWDKFVESVSKPLNLNITWPEAPEWLKYLSGLRDNEMRNEQIFRKFGFEDGDYKSTWSMPTSTDMLAVQRAEAARRAAAGDPFAQFPSVAPLPTPSLMDRVSGLGYSAERVNADAAWGGRDTVNGATLAASIPQSVSISVTSDVRLTAGSLAVEYRGPIGGPSSVSVGGEASRGTSTATVGGASSSSAVGVP